jgi:hypothetical protein
VALSARCAWCAPTARAVVEVSPWTPAGGAAFCAPPWQTLQVDGVMSRSPSTWSVTFTVVAVYPSWHPPQLVLAGCGAGGGEPWHVPHAAWPAPPTQLGSVFVPPAARVAPWQ